MIKVPRSKRKNVEDIGDTKNEKMYQTSSLSSTQLDTVILHQGHSNI